ncbi:sensory rhodopsin transducer [Halobacteria archaeon AArc-dxtr1]|nr:sensory rhodopsin transducer [Halobacteria archaeon AArc-dxtr1]
MTGKRTWAIPEGYIPAESNGPEPEMVSHESVCILNTTDEAATVEITVYFTDRDPVGPYEKTVPAQRTRHFRFNEFEDPEEIPRGEPFASVLESDTPVVCQHTRLDSRQAENALLSTMAYAGE